MKVNELVGKLAIRTAPTERGDHSYMETPILIEKVTDNHIFYQHLEFIAGGHISVNKTPKVTGKGQAYFINKFLEEVS